MKTILKLIAIILLITSLNTCNVQYIFTKKKYNELQNNWQWVYTQVKKYQKWLRGYCATEKYARRLADVIIQYSVKYDLPYKKIYKQIEWESGCQYWKVSKAGAHGLMGIIPKYHWPILLKLEPDLKEHIKLLKHKGIEIDKKKYFKRIGYNVHIGCYLMRHWLNKNDGCFKLALLEYNCGGAHSIYRYVKEISEYE